MRISRILCATALALAVTMGLVPIAHALTGGTNISVSNGLVSITGQVGVANGGTAVSSWTANNSVLLTGSTSTAAVAVVAGGTAKNVLVSGGAGVAPTFTTVDLTSSNAVNGILPIANGGTNLSAASDDNVMVGNGTTWQSKALTTCTGAGKAVTYDASANTFGCNTITAGVQAPLAMSTLGSITQGTTLYMGIGTGNVSTTDVDVGVPFNAHTLQNLQCYSSAAPAGSDTFTFTSGKGTCGSALTYTGSPATCAISAAGKTCSDVTNPVALTTGQCAAVKAVASATAATAILNCTIDVTA